MKKTGMTTGAAVLFLAGAAVAELPVPTSAPVQEWYGSFEVLRQDLESLQGSVVEVIYDQTLFQRDEGVDVDLCNTPSGIYAAEWRREEGCPWISIVFEIPEEGVLKFYNRRAWQINGVHEFEESRREFVSGPVYFYITSEPFVRPGQFQANYPKDWNQAVRVIAVGDDFVQNEDGSVCYIWTETPDGEEYKFKEKWTVENLSFLGRALRGRESVIKVAFGKVKDAAKDEVSGEFTGWLTDNRWWLKDLKIRAVFPPEAEKFFEKLDKIKGRDFTIVYAQVEYPLNGELTLRVLGAKKRGRADYRW